MEFNQLTLENKKKKGYLLGRLKWTGNLVVLWRRRKKRSLLEVEDTLRDEGRRRKEKEEEEEKKRKKGKNKTRTELKYLYRIAPHHSSGPNNGKENSTRGGVKANEFCHNIYCDGCLVTENFVSSYFTFSCIRKRHISLTVDVCSRFRKARR